MSAGGPSEEGREVEVDETPCGTAAEFVVYAASARFGNKQERN